MIPILSRRRLLTASAAGFFGSALSQLASAQTAVQPPPKRAKPDEFSVTEPVSIEVNARPLAGFDTRDRSRVRFGDLEFRSGLVLTSGFRGFGG
ncbi:MAG TPA: twin-arginine translocation pathway signal, partial [Bradyrhizobium sp.]